VLPDGVLPDGVLPDGVLFDEALKMRDRVDKVAMKKATITSYIA
jgi:hypothetical protein